MFKRHPYCQAVRKSETYKRHTQMVIVGGILFFIGFLSILMNRQIGNLYPGILLSFAGTFLTMLFLTPLFQMIKQCELGTMYVASYQDVVVKLNQRSFRISMQYVNLEGEIKTIESYEYFGWLDIESYRNKRYKILVVPNQVYATVIEILHD